MFVIFQGVGWSGPLVSPSSGSAHDLGFTSDRNISLSKSLNSIKYACLLIFNVWYFTQPKEKARGMYVVKDFFCIMFYTPFLY